MAFEDDVALFAAGVNAELPKRIIIVRGDDANGDPTTRSEPEVASLIKGSMYFQDDVDPKKLWIKFGPNQADWQAVADETRLSSIEDTLLTLADDLTDAQLDISNLTTQVGDLENEIVDLQTQITNIAAQLETVPVYDFGADDSWAVNVESTVTDFGLDDTWTEGSVEYNANFGADDAWGELVPA